MGAALAALSGAAFCAVVCTALGVLLLRGAGVKLYRQEERLLGFVSGAALLSAIVFGLCAARIATPWLFLGLGGAVLAVAFRRGAHRAQGEPLPPLAAPWKLLLAAVFAAYLYLYVPNALAPEASPDGITYHLGLVSRYLRDRGFVPLREQMYAQLSQGVEMLFLFAFAFGKHSAAALTHFCFLLALPLLMLSYARRFGFAEAGVCAAILFFASPVAGADGTSAYNDVAVAASAFTLFYLLQIWWSAGRADAWRWFAAVGLVAGFCFAAKYTAFVAIPYALATLLARRIHRPLRPLAVVAVCAAAVALPWLVKNWLFVGNPVAPMWNAVFLNPYQHAGFDTEYTSYLRLYELKSRLQLPLAVTTTGEGAVSGVLGPIFLLAPVGLLALRVPHGRRLWVAALVFAAAYPLNTGTRFLLPALPFVALAMALAFVHAPRLAFALALAHAIVCWPSVLARYTAVDSWRLYETPWRAAFRRETEDAFLTRRTDMYGAARMIDRLVPPGERVFTFTGMAEAYTSREIVTRYQSALGKNIGFILWCPVIEDYRPTRQHWFSWRRKPLRRIRIYQTAQHPTDHWSIAEFRVFLGESELPRRPEWRLRAWPNPFEVQFAFDNSPATRWSTWQPIYPGMYLEVDFGRDEIADSVVLEMSHDQYGVEMKLDGRYPDGHWQALDDGRPVDVQAPNGLRRIASQDVKRLGIRYLIIHDDDYEAADYRDGAAAWGFTAAGDYRGWRLYRID